MEQLYKRYPHNVDAQIGYAHCLLAKGEDNKALSLLHNIANQHNHVAATFMLANYIGSGGTFDDTVDKDSIDKTIEAYQRVLLYINSDPNYPRKGNTLYERERQMELTSIFRVPLWYYQKFMSGTDGSDNNYLLRSSSYTGNRDLNTYSEYSPYTMDSLRKTIQFANHCLVLPQKRHFKSDSYEDV